MYKFAQIMKDKNVQKVTKPIHLVIPMIERNWFISIIPSNNISKNSRIEMQYETLDKDIIDTLLINVPKKSLDKNMFLKVYHAQNIAFIDSPLYNKQTEFLQDDLIKYQTRFDKIIQELDLLFNDSIANIKEKINERTASIRINDKPQKVEEKYTQYVIDDSEYKCYILIITDYPDNVADIMIQFEHNDKIIDKMWIMISQEYLKYQGFSVYHDDTYDFAIGIEHDKNMKPIKLRKQDISNRFQVIMNELKNIIAP